MKITTATFVKSAANIDGLPKDTKPHIIFIGRSNVGKSSLLNTLTHHAGLAHVSKTPGRTQLINIFDINKKMYFIDLPGYGFAKIPKNVQAEITERVSSYIHECTKIKLAIIICDAKIGPTTSDTETIALISDAGIPIAIIANKWDSLNAHERIKSVKRFHDAYPAVDIIPHSAKSGEGDARILGIISETLA